MAIESILSKKSLFIGLQYHLLISMVDCVYIRYTAPYLEFEAVFGALCTIT